MKWSCNSLKQLYMAHRHPIRFVITYHLFVSKGETQTYGYWDSAPLDDLWWRGWTSERDSLWSATPSLSVALKLIWRMLGYIRTDFSQNELGKWENVITNRFYIYNMPQYHIFEYLFCVKIYFFILILFFRKLRLRFRCVFNMHFKTFVL